MTDRADVLPEYLDVGEGSALLFLHGLGGDRNNWQPQIDAFSTSHRCIAWTLPGYGDSPPLHPLTWQRLSDTVANLLDYLEVEVATVIGLSMGGYIAQQFAADHPDRIHKLVLAATTAQFGRGSETFAEKFLASRLKPIDEGAVPGDFAPAVVAGLLSDQAPAESVSNAVRSMSRITAPAYRAALECLVTWDFVDRLGEITAPTRCLAGSLDRTAPVAAVEALANGLPNGTLHVLDDSHHLLNLDRPEVFNHALQDFLSRGS